MTVLKRMFIIRGEMDKKASGVEATRVYNECIYVCVCIHVCVDVGGTEGGEREGERKGMSL